MLLFCLLLPMLSCFAQDSTDTSDNNLLQSRELFEAAALLNKKWGSDVNFDRSMADIEELSDGKVKRFYTAEYVSVDEVASRCISFASTSKDLVKEKFKVDQLFIQSHLKGILTFLKSLIVPGNQLPLYIEPSWGPTFTHFVQDGGEVTFVLMGIVDDAEFNSNQLTAKQRAVEVLQKSVLPLAMKFGTIQDSTWNDVSNVAFLVNYRCRDFLNKKDEGNAEMLCAIFSRESCSKYASFDATEDELVRGAKFLLSDRNMDGEIKRTELNIE